MKKVLSIMAVAVAVTTGASAKMSHGLYGGLGLGHMKAQSNVSFLTGNNGGVSETSRIVGDKFAGALFLGYRLGLSDKVFAGLELDAQNGYTVKGESDVSSRAATVETANQKVKASWAWGGSLLLGYHLNKNAYVAVRAGLESRTFKITPNVGLTNFIAPLTTNGNATAIRKFSHTSFVPGVLLGMPLGECWEVSGDYRWVMGEKKSKGQNSTTDMRWSHTPKSSTFMVRASYKFMSR